MIAVQSLWMGAEQKREQRAELWRLSNGYLRERFERVEVWADAPGEDWLRAAGTEYDAWHRLPEIPEEARAVWSLGKLLAAAAQMGPFLHVDGDVFWRQPRPDAPFLVQHAEHDKPAGVWWDRFGLAPVRRPASPVSYNFGVFGGTAWKEIAEACRTAAAYSLAHRAWVAGCRRCGFLPMLVEQVWVPAILAARGVRPTCLLRYDWLQEDAREMGYFHAMGGKDNPALVARIAEKAGGVDMKSKEDANRD